MTDWWSNIEKEIDRLSESAPDPWADADDFPAVALTDEQVAFLQQLDTVSALFVDHDDWDRDETNGTADETATRSDTPDA